MVSMLCCVVLVLCQPQSEVAEKPPVVAERFDLVLRQGQLIDGLSRTVRPGSVGIRDGRIVSLGDVAATPDTPVLELNGLYVAPGFLDLHTHVDSDIVRQPLAANFLRMGVTTIITGNCGSSVRDLGAHLRRLERGGVGVNYGSLVGHGTVRTQVLGNTDRAPEPQELLAMQALVAQAMREGAFGLSTGLIYVPGTFAKTAEITALARIAAQHGGRYVTHMRNENDRILEAIDEALQIGRDAGLPVHLSHVKCSGKANHGRSAEVLAKLAAARQQQVVTADQYAYDASSTGLDVLMPSRELAPGRAPVAERLRKDVEFRARMHQALLHKMDSVGYGDFQYARIANARGMEALNGLLLPDAAEKHLGSRSREAQADLVIALFTAAAPARVGMVYHSMDEHDVERFLASDWIALASDAGLRPEAGVEKPHPRGAGNTARLLGRYVRERGVLDLPLAVHKLTSLPAAQFGIDDRGLLQVGAFADLVVFDPEQIADLATYEDPLLPPRGIAWVLVNGVVAVAQGQATGVRAGQVLRHLPAAAGK